MSAQNKAWIGTSWKMNKTLAQAQTFAEGLLAASINERIQPFLVPPFTALRQVKSMLASTAVRVGAQNMHWADEGAWTGEISPTMLTDCGADLVELGHSERRAHFGETDETVGKKVEAAVRHGLVPLICIGETLEQRDAGQADSVLQTQIEAAFGLLSGAQKTATVLLAYEPVWAIGEHGEPASPDYADERQAQIAKIAHTMIGQAVPCLYGGSVNPNNCVDLISRPHVDGLFIGRSAWNVESYLDIMDRCAKALN